jgi:hypothetical protein
MSQLIDELGGIEAIGIFSLCLFVVVFTAAMVLAFCLKKPFLKSMGELPLEDEQAKAKTPTPPPL